MPSWTVHLLSASNIARSWNPSLRSWFEEVVGEGGKNLKEKQAIRNHAPPLLPKNRRSAHQTPNN
jgi:hypothetical protein